MSIAYLKFIRSISIRSLRIKENIITIMVRFILLYFFVIDSIVSMNLIILSLTGLIHIKEEIINHINSQNIGIDTTNKSVISSLLVKAYSITFEK